MPTDRARILDLLGRRAGGASLGDLARLLSLPPHARRTLKRELRALTTAGLVRFSRGKFVAANGSESAPATHPARGGSRPPRIPHSTRGGRPSPPFSPRPAAAPAAAAPHGANIITGRFTRNAEGGFGFVSPLEKKPGEVDVFVPPDAIGSALHGDIVDVRVGRVDAGGRKSGRIVGVRERTRAGIPGRFERRGKQAYVVPDDKRMAPELFISKKDENGAREGQLVIAKITAPPSRDFSAKGEVVRVLGDREDPGTDSDLVLAEYGITIEFSAGALAESAAFPEEISDEERRRRRNLAHVPFVTIDGSTAKDFDDAVAVEMLPDGRYRLYVAIADVASYVRPGSPLEADAFARATSVYLPDRVVPMLPERLSNDLCSLKPDEERLALCAAMDFDATGALKGAGIDRVIFKSRARMTYEEVHGILVDKHPHLLDRYRALLPEIERMGALAVLLRKRRFEQGSIDFDLPEPEIVLDLRGATADIVRAPRYVSHRIVEEFMLAANVVVARHFAERDIPIPYRIHDLPDPARLDIFNEVLRPYGVTLTEKDLSTPRAVGKVLAKFEGKSEERVVNHLMLRAMRQAQYSADNIGHFGLAFEHYCHFTSPIRRYPDLLVHRAVHAFLDGPKALSRYVQWAQESLPEACTQSSTRERTAMEAERASVALKKVRFMREKIGEIFAGHVTGVAKHGLFVELDDIFVEGRVAMDAIGKDDLYEFDEATHRIVGRRSGRKFRLGDAVTVEAIGVSLERRTIDFRLARKA